MEAGDAKLLLPGLIERLDRIDLFFHDSDHTYQHMVFSSSSRRCGSSNQTVLSLRMTLRGMRLCGTLQISTTFRVKEH
jgi:hypothetical protein